MHQNHFTQVVCIVRHVEFRRGYVQILPQPLVGLQGVQPCNTRIGTLADRLKYQAGKILHKRVIVITVFFVGAQVVQKEHGFARFHRGGRHIPLL